MSQIVLAVNTGNKLQIDSLIGFSLRNILCLKTLDDFLDSKFVNGRYIMHNTLFVNKSGVVTNIDANGKRNMKYACESCRFCKFRSVEIVLFNLNSIHNINFIQTW